MQKKENVTIKLVIGVIVGILIGLISNQDIMVFVVTVKSILGQLIMFSIPLIILGFVAPSIAKLKSRASKLLCLSLALAYFSSIFAAAFSAINGYIIIPFLNISSQADSSKELPKVIFELNIPPIMTVISALVLSFIIGLSTAWTNSDIFSKILHDFQKMILLVVTKMVIPILPFFISSTFAEISYQGSLTKQLPIFISIILIVLVGHIIWLFVLYSLAGIYSKKNPIDVLKHYLPAYLTAVGTMSSAATLPVSLSCAKKSTILSDDSINFGIPLFSNIHLCGSVLTEVFFVMVVSQIVYGKLPDVTSMIVFIVLLGIFAVGAPGVPGGTVVASLGIIVSILGFDNTSTALMMTIFALQDSFGTACNVVGDGALTLVIETYSNNKKVKQN